MKSQGPDQQEDQQPLNCAVKTQKAIIIRTLMVDNSIDIILA